MEIGCRRVGSRSGHFERSWAACFFDNITTTLRAQEQISITLLRRFAWCTPVWSAHADGTKLIVKK